MGTTISNFKHGMTAKAYFDYVYNIDSKKSCTNGGCYYAIDHNQHTGLNYAFVVKYEIKKGRIAYKEMDEAMYPYYFGMPDKLLAMLYETDNEHAKKWRETCRKFNDIKTSIKTAKQTGKPLEIPQGIPFTNGLRAYKVVFHERNLWYCFTNEKKTFLARLSDKALIDYINQYSEEN